MNGFPPWFIPKISWTLWWVVEHETNENYTPIMPTSFKISKRYLSNSDSENETEFTRFIIIESLDEIKLDQLSPFLIEKSYQVRVIQKMSKNLGMVTC